MEIRDAVVIVTGASEGLGEASARLFTSQGARVALAARSHDKLNQMAKELSGSFAIPVDLRDSAAIAQMVAAVRDHYGRIDLLINNAAQAMHGFLEQVELAQYRSLMDLNLFAPLLTMQAVIPIMRKQGGGMILNVSAPLARMPFIPSLGAYGSTKAALTLITLTARRTGGRQYSRRRCLSRDDGDRYESSPPASFNGSASRSSLGSGRRTSCRRTPTRVSRSGRGKHPGSGPGGES